MTSRRLVMTLIHNTRMIMLFIIFETKKSEIKNINVGEIFFLLTTIYFKNMTFIYK